MEPGLWRPGGAYNELLPEFHKHDAELLDISVDGVWCHAAFARDRHLHFRCSPISSPRARSQGNIAPIAQARHLRTRAVRPRPKGNHRMELLLSDCGLAADTGA